MSEPSVATLWASVRGARPHLVPHARLHRRDVRGEPWAIVHNDVSGVQVRLNACALDVVVALDGRRTLAEVVDERVPEADVAYREALAESLVTLESGGLLRLGRESDTARLVARADALARARRRAFDPLSLRIPLLDPDRRLARLHAVLLPLVGRPAAVALGALFASGVAVGVAAFPDIGAELSRLARTPSGWWLYALLYPALKIAHELAHALLVKHHGGAVHEAGVTMLVLMPLPYVDASDSAAFERRGQRLAVGAAGMLAEGAIACAGLLLWSVTESGLVHDVAFAAALLGSVSTLVFNANPLLRFDGYHLLQDALDIPNLGTRASALLSWSVRRHLLRAAVGASPVTGPRERRWLLGYGLSSLAYRWALTFAIALWLASAVPVVGVALALFALRRLLWRPLAGGVRYLRRSPELDGRRTRAVVATVGGALVLGALVLLVPLPSSTRAEGVVRASTQATLHATVGGEVVGTSVARGGRVRTGDAVLRLVAPELRARRAVLEAEIGVLVARRHAELGRDPVAAAALAADLAVRRAEVTTLAREIGELTLRSPGPGRFAPIEGRIVSGRRVARGEVLGHIVGGHGLHVEAVVDQRAVGRVRDGVRTVRVRLAERVDEVLDAHVVAAAPAGDRRLPSTALAGDGTRGIAVASEGGVLRTLEPVFHVELGLPGDARASGIGGRAYVTLVHDPESLGRRWWRATRQLFLEKLSV